jgi:hypothetical protein
MHLKLKGSYAPMSKSTIKKRPGFIQFLTLITMRVLSGLGAVESRKAPRAS